MKKRFKPVEMVVIGAIIFMLCSTQSWAIQIKNGTTAVVSVLARNASNLSQYITGLTTGTTNITVYRKNMSALSMTTNTLSEVANGLYRVTLNGTFTNTTGELIYRINWTSGDYWGRDEVVDNILGEIYAKANAANDTASTISGKIIGTIAAGTHNPQSGDAYAVVNNADYGNAKLVRSTTPANTLDIDSDGNVTSSNAGSGATAEEVRLEMDTNSTKLTAINDTVQTNLDEKVSTRSDFNASTDPVFLNKTTVI
jgi:hypothetical protein